MTEEPGKTAGEAPRRGRTALIVAGALLAGALAGLAGVYGMGGLTRNEAVAVAPSQPTVNVADAPECKAASETAKRIAPLAKGELAAFAPTLTPRRVPDLAFTAADGKATTLSQVEPGGLRLVNIWATWCVPCRQEMPALDELQAELGTGSDFEVVAVNVDTRDPDKPKEFLEETGIKHLAFFTDPKAQSFQELRTVGRGFGLPTTILVDGKGCEIGHIAGPAEWASPDALALLRAALEAKAATN